MQTSPGEVLERPFVGERNEGEEEVQGLENGNGFDGGIEEFCEEVEEDFGPEEAFERGCYLVFVGVSLRAEVR